MHASEREWGRDLSFKFYLWMPFEFKIDADAELFSLSSCRMQFGEFAKTKSQSEEEWGWVRKHKSRREPCSAASSTMPQSLLCELFWHFFMLPFVLFDATCFHRFIKIYVTSLFSLSLALNAFDLSSTMFVKNWEWNAPSCVFDDWCWLEPKKKLFKPLDILEKKWSKDMTRRRRKCFCHFFFVSSSSSFIILCRFFAASTMLLSLPLLELCARFCVV